MKFSQTGSILVVVLMVVASIVLGVAHMMRSFSYANQIVFARQQYQQKLYATEGLLNFGITKCSEHYSDLTKLRQQGSLRIQHWPCADGKEYEGLVTIDARNDSVFIHAILQQDNRAIVSVSCRLGQTDDDEFTIDDWTIETT